MLLHGIKAGENIRKRRLAEGRGKREFRLRRQKIQHQRPHPPRGKFLQLLRKRRLNRARPAQLQALQQLQQFPPVLRQRLRRRGAHRIGLGEKLDSRGIPPGGAEIQPALHPLTTCDETDHANIVE